MAKRRLYLGRLLRSIRYMPAYNGIAAEFRVQIMDNDRRVHTYKGATIQEIIGAIKADGWQVWGQDALDYSLPPENALEYVLAERILKSMGKTDAEIQEWFSFSEDTETE
jgi:hypothetical protein